MPRSLSLASALVAAIALFAPAAHAFDWVIRGSFTLSEVQGTDPSPFTATVGNENEWQLVLRDVTFSYQEDVVENTKETRLEAADFDFRAWNHAQDAGRPWSEAEAEATRSHPHWREHILA